MRLVAQESYFWVEDAYTFGCKLIHFSNFHDYETVDPFDTISSESKEAITGFLRDCHHYIDTDIDSSAPSRLLLSNDNMISEGDPRSVLQVSCSARDFSEENVSGAEQLRADCESLLRRQKDDSTASKVRIAKTEGSLPKTVTLTEPVEVRDPASFIVLKFSLGKTFPLLASIGAQVRVSYRDHELVIPVSATDLR